MACDWLLGMSERGQDWWERMTETRYLAEQLERIRQLSEQMSRVREQLSEGSDIALRDARLVRSGPLQAARDRRSAGDVATVESVDDAAPASRAGRSRERR